MRVVSGKAKGTPLRSVPGDSTRPILDRVKAALFDVLRPELNGTAWLDLFGGSGAVGIEALSQGAHSCIFTEINQAACSTIKENLEATKLGELAKVQKRDAFQYLKNANNDFDFIYVAPPQYKNLWVEAMHSLAERPHLLRDGGQIIVQIDPSEYEALSLNSIAERSQRRYGKTLLVFYEKSLQ